MKARLVLGAMVAVLASACAPGEIELVLDEFGGDGELIADDDPAVRASAQSADEVRGTRRAEDAIDRVFSDVTEGFPLDAPVRLVPFDDAQKARPTDPRYDMYEAVYLLAIRSGDGGAEDSRLRVTAEDALLRAVDKISTQNFTRDRAEWGRMAHEMYMDTMLDVIRRLPSSPERDSLASVYCDWITNKYPSTHSKSFPADVAFYLATEADRSVCGS